MKYLIATTSILFLSTLAFGQSVKIKGEKVLVDKQLYCYLEKGGNAMSVWTYTIKNLQEKELMFLKSTTVEISEGNLKAYYTVTITDTEETFEIEHFMGFKKDFIRKLYKFEVIQNNKINEAGLKKYKRTYAGNFQEQYEKEANRSANSTTTKVIVVNNTDNYIIVERDKSSLLFISNGKVKQDFKQIATFKVEKENINNEKLDVIYIYNINNQLVAKGFTDSFEESVTIFIFGVREEYLVMSKSSLDSHKVEVIMELLIEKLYI